jgi:hypothetical protein
MARPTVRLPTWATDGGADVTDPGASKQDDGWIESEAPAADHTNWLLNNIGQWLSWFDQIKPVLAHLAPDDWYDSTAQVSDPNGISFADDGSRFYVTEPTSTKIYEYTTSTDWQLAGSTYASSDYTVGEDTDIGPPQFNADGTKMFVMGINDKTIYRYSLGPAWDVSTASYDTNSLDLSTQTTGTITRGFILDKNGTRIYACDDQNDVLYQYNLGTGYDLSSGSYASKSLSISDISMTQIRGLAMLDAGMQIWLGGVNTSLVIFTTAYELDSAIVAGEYSEGVFLGNSLSASNPSISSLFASPSGHHVYIAEGGRTNYVYRCPLG